MPEKDNLYKWVSIDIIMNGTTLKDIFGYEGKYQITNDGRVYSLKRKKYLKPFYKQGGYWRVGLKGAGGKSRHHSIHRLVANAFIANPMDYPQINHIDGNKKNNNISNLEWCNASQNLKHAYLLGLQKKAYLEEHSHCKQTKESIRILKRIILLNQLGEIYIKDSHIAKIFNIAQSNITKCKRGILYNPENNNNG